MEAPEGQASYAQERAGERGGAMEKIMAKMAGDDSALREAERKRNNRVKMHTQAMQNKRMVLKEMLFENYEEHLIERRVNHGTVTDFGWKRMRRQRDQDHMNGEFPEGGLLNHMVRLHKPKPTTTRHPKKKKPWPDRKKLSPEEQALAILEGDTSATLKDGVALAKASSKVKTTLPMYYEGLRLHRVIQVSTGFGHTLILTQVGVVLSYGNNLEGQLGHGDQKPRSGAKVIKKLKGITIVGVAAGLHHSCVIAKASFKKTFTFGKNDRSQLGHGDPKKLPRCTVPMLVDNIWSTNHPLEPAQVSAGNYHTGVVDIHGALYTWGDNRHGQLGIGSVPATVLGHRQCALRPADTPGAPRRVIGPLGSAYKYPVDHVSCGAFHTAVVTESGSLWTCGKVKGGQLGHATQMEDLTEFKPIDSLEQHNIVHADAGSHHTVCCDDEGLTFSFGSNENKQLGLTGTSMHDEWNDKRHEQHFSSRHQLASRGLPVKPMERLPSRGSTRSPSRGSSRSPSRGSNRSPSRGSSRNMAGSRPGSRLLQLRDQNSTLPEERGRTADTTHNQTVSYPKNSNKPRRIMSLEGKEVRQVAAGGKHTLFITKEGNLYSCGTAGSNARLGHLNDEEQSVPKLVEYFTVRTISDDDNWVIQFGAIFSMNHPPAFVHDRKRAFPKDAAVLDGKLMNGNNISLAQMTDVKQGLVDVKHANVKRQLVNLFRHYDNKKRGYLGPLHIEYIFPRAGIFLFDFQVDRMCAAYHKPGDRGGKNEISEQRVMEYLADTRKDLPSKNQFLKTMNAVWQKNIAPKSKEFSSDEFIYEFLDLFEKKCLEYGEPAPHEAVHILSKPLPPPGRKKPLKKETRRYKKLLRGSVDLRRCGLTDVHMKALMFAQKAIPIFHTIDLRMNLLSELALQPILETIDWTLDVDDLGIENTYCWKCAAVVEFNKVSSNTCFCLQCGTTNYRPRYLLWNVQVMEKSTSPEMNIKWTELAFDETCLASIADQLESHEQMTPQEYEDMIWEIGQGFLDDFAATIRTPLIAVTKKDKKAVALKVKLLDHFDKWIKRRFAERYWDMYHQQAVQELFETVRTLCKEMASKVNAAVHAAIPTSTKHILSVTQNFHGLAKTELDENKWHVPALMPYLYETVFLAARNIFRHYAAANLDCKPDSVSCGERYSTIAMESGRVVTIGNQDDLIETFKEEILGNLPSRFRKMFAVERIKEAKKHAKKQMLEAKLLKEVEAAEEELLREREEEELQNMDDEQASLSSPPQSVHSHLSKQSQQSQKSNRHSNQSESDESDGSDGNDGSDGSDVDDDDASESNQENNQENVAPTNSATTIPQVPAYYNNRTRADAFKKATALSDASNNQNNTKPLNLSKVSDPTNPNNNIVFTPMETSLLDSKVGEFGDEFGEEDEEEMNDEGPASPMRYSPVRQSPIRRLNLTQQLNRNRVTKDKVLAVVGHQIPSFTEEEPDEYHRLVQKSKPILHARDVIDDPEDFDSLFETMHRIFKNGHDHSIDDPDSMLQQTEAVYTFAKTEWGDEAFMKEHAHQVEVEHEKKRLQQHIERHAEDELHHKIPTPKEESDDTDSLEEFHSEFHNNSEYDSSNITELGGLDEFDGERTMEHDSVYVFSGGRTTTRKLRLGSSDQDTSDGILLEGEHVHFFSDTRPRLRTHDMFGRRLK